MAETSRRQHWTAEAAEQRHVLQVELDRCGAELDRLHERRDALRRGLTQLEDGAAAAAATSERERLEARGDAAAGSFIWRPAELFGGAAGSEEEMEAASSTKRRSRRPALIVLNQPLELDAAVYARLWAACRLHVAADGGANQVDRLTRRRRSRRRSGGNGGGDVPLRLDAIVGDLDSVETDVRQRFTKACDVDIVLDEDKYATDFTKAVHYVRTGRVRPGAVRVSTGSVTDGVAAAATTTPTTTPPLRNEDGDFDVAPCDIVCLGGLGGRVDQGLGQLHQLFTLQDEAYSSGRIYLLSTHAITFVLMPGRHDIHCRPDHAGGHHHHDDAIGPALCLGEHVGIVPLGATAVISTKGLVWDVKEWTTSFDGQISTNNLVKDEWCRVETDKPALFTIEVLMRRRGSPKTGHD